MPQVDLAGTSFHYELASARDGARQEVVMLANSLGTNLHLWDGQMEALGAHFAVLRYDQRGHGSSGLGSAEFGIDQLGRDALLLLDALDIERAHFAGISMGGVTGMWMATHAPERLLRIALCNTAGYLGPREKNWLPRIAAVRAGGMPAVTEAVLERWFTERFRHESPAVVETIRAQLLATSAEGYIASCMAISELDQRESIRSISAPTLVISGTHDPSTPAFEGQLLAERIKGARYVELSAAHLSNVEASAEFNAALVSFLTEEAA